MLVRLQLALVAGLFTVSLVVSEMGVDQGMETIAFALPATQSETMSWQTEDDAFGHKVSQAFGVHRQTATEFAGWILEASERQDLDPELLASLVLTESSFRKNAVSNVGAIGPAQVRPEYWSGFCGSNIIRQFPIQSCEIKTKPFPLEARFPQHCRHTLTRTDGYIAT